MWRRALAAVSLFFLSPLVAEYLLGSLPLTMIWLLPIMALMYGSGAVLIREALRRSGRSWLTLILLAMAYGFVEEGLVTQSLFNPNYLHLRLLDYGYLSWLGTGAPWLVYVIGLHVFWSISVPIALTESLFVEDREKPWLHWAGIALFALLFVGGAALIGFFTYKQAPFMASPVQLGASVTVVIALIVAAFGLPKRPMPKPGDAPHPLIIFAVVLICGSGFVGAEMWAPQWRLPWPAALALMLGFVGAALAFVLGFTNGRAWSNLQRFALMAGGLGVYIWLGVILDRQLHPTDSTIAHAILIAFFLALCAIAALRARKPNPRA
ncbi:MAG: hypothetical protein ABUL73_06060 [Alphaproteobacteria bacterium]